MSVVRGKSCMEVRKNESLADCVYALDLGGNFPWAKTRPGQFVNILVGAGKEHPLRRPLSIASINASAGTLRVVYRVVGEGTKWLSEQGQGKILDVLGPLGRGFPLPSADARVLIVGGGVGIPPLYQLAREIRPRSKHIDIVLGFKSAKDCFWLEEFAQYGNVRVTTEDGSKGLQGVVTDAFDPGVRWDYLYACGPRAMLRALWEHFSDTAIKGYVSLEERMACGVGACQGCVCRSRDGLSTMRVCKDGPVFAWEEVAL